MILDIQLNVEEASLCEPVGTLQEFLDSKQNCRYTLLKRPETPPSGFMQVEAAGDADFKDWRHQFAPRLADLELFKIRNAFVFPRFGVVVTERGEALRHSMHEAAYKTQNLRLLPGAFPRGEATAIDIPDDIGRLEKISLTMPWGPQLNYGHFVLEALPAAVTLDQHGLFQSHAPVVSRLENWHRRHFDLLRFYPAELPDQVIRADEVIYTSAMDHYLHAPNLNYLDVVRRQRQHLLPSPSKWPSRIYLSRGENKRRIFVSEDLLIDRLRAMDFQVVDPISLTVDEQIACFGNADVIAGPTGAAFANALYCKPGTSVIEIQPTGMESYWVHMLCAICGSRCLTYDCNSLSGTTRTQLTYDIDVPRFLDSMLGFIGRRAAK